MEALGNDVSAAKSVPAAIFAFLKEFSARYVCHLHHNHLGSKSRKKPNFFHSPDNPNADDSKNQSPFVRTLKTAMTFGGKSDVRNLVSSQELFTKKG